VSPEAITTAVAAVAIIAFLWNLHRDVADLRERMSRLEGTVDLLAKVLIDREQKRTGPQATIPHGKPYP